MGTQHSAERPPFSLFLGAFGLPTLMARLQLQCKTEGNKDSRLHPRSCSVHEPTG